MWRKATGAEDEEIVAMSAALYVEAPSTMPVPEGHTRRTLAMLRAEPTRGCAVVLELNNAIAGYAFLISFWSNELGGEVVVLDEFYVRPAYRSRGYGRMLITALIENSGLWPNKSVAVELEVTPQNQRAANLYATLGFKAIVNARYRFRAVV